MPRRDATGPRGMGPRTGRGLGPCGGNEVPMAAIAPGIGLGLGLGWRWGRRRGGRGGFGPGPLAESVPAAPANDTQALRQQVAALESQLAAVKQQLEQIDE